MKTKLIALCLGAFLAVMAGCGASVAPGVAPAPATVDEPAPMHEPD